MKIITKKEIAPLALILLMFIVGAYFYGSLPDKVPTHWNAQGEVDAWSSKKFAVFFFPLLTIGVWFLMAFVPLIDPLRKNYEKFATAYYVLRLAFVIFFALLYFYTLSSGLGLKHDIRFFIIPFMGLLFIAIGLALPRMKRNWFVGIRTPWTLQSEQVWNKTHKLGSRVFILMGLLSAFSVFAGDYSFFVFLVIILIGAFIPVVYSYIYYRKLGFFKNQKSHQ